MKAIVNKKGFTLTEVLVVIALIGILLLLIMPNLTNFFKGGINNTMKIQENELKEAGLLYLEDFCKNPLNNNICPASIHRENNLTYSGYITLSTLVNNDYIENITLRGANCNGCVIYENNKANAYITCENGEYETKSSVDYKTTCGL